MPHPNQLALPVAVDRWIGQSQSLDDRAAVDRLTEKQALIAKAMQVVCSDVDEVPADVAGLSYFDLVSAEASLAVEIAVRSRGIWAAAAYFDAPAHPLGLVTHPDWDAVRDRYNALRCAAITSGAIDFRDQKAGGRFDAPPPGAPETPPPLPKLSETLSKESGDEPPQAL